MQSFILISYHRKNLPEKPYTCILTLIEKPFVNFPQHYYQTYDDFVHNFYGLLKKKVSNIGESVGTV